MSTKHQNLREMKRPVPNSAANRKPAHGRRIADSASYIAREWKLVCLREATGPANLGDGDSPSAIARYWREVIVPDPHHLPDVESLYVLHLNTRKRITGHHLVAQGLLDTVLAHPREVFRAAVVANASAIILAHNHPSGDPTPSEGDIRVTRQLIGAGSIVQIPLLDHVIVGTPCPECPGGFSSLRDDGYFFTDKPRFARRRRKPASRRRRVKRASVANGQSNNHRTPGQRPVVKGESRGGGAQDPC